MATMKLGKPISDETLNLWLENLEEDKYYSSLSIRFKVAKYYNDQYSMGYFNGIWKMLDFQEDIYNYLDLDPIYDQTREMLAGIKNNYGEETAIQAAEIIEKVDTTCECKDLD